MDIRWEYKAWGIWYGYRNGVHVLNVFGSDGNWQWLAFWNGYIVKRDKLYKDKELAQEAAIRGLKWMMKEDKT